MPKNNILQFEGREAISKDTFTHLIRTGAQHMLRAEIKAEVQDYILQFQSRLLENGRAVVLRNGHQPERDLQTGRYQSKDCLLSNSMPYMTFIVGQCTQKRWCRSRDFDRLANVIRGVNLKDGVEVRTTDQFAA